MLLRTIPGWFFITIFYILRLDLHFKHSRLYHNVYSPKVISTVQLAHFVRLVIMPRAQDQLHVLHAQQEAQLPTPVKLSAVAVKPENIRIQLEPLAVPRAQRESIRLLKVHRPLLPVLIVHLAIMPQVLALVRVSHVRQALQLPTQVKLSVAAVLLVNTRVRLVRLGVPCARLVTMLQAPVLVTVLFVQQGLQLQTRA